MSTIQYSSIPLWANVSPSQWDDWHWQLKNVVRSPQELNLILKDLVCSEIDPPNNSHNGTTTFGVKLTPFLVATIHLALQRGDLKAVGAMINTFIPREEETVTCGTDSMDGIGEEQESAKPVTLVTNFYGNRVLLFAANTCPAHCRFCFRRRKVGDNLPSEIERGTSRKAIQSAVRYIQENRAIREVIISGGDPLTLSDNRLLTLLQRLKAIDHVKVLRIDTKVFTTLPQRITTGLVEQLRKFRPLYVVGNFLHPVELTPEVLQSVRMLTDSGIPVFSHTALLKGINDDTDTMLELMWNLYINHIIPYYLIQFIPTKWTEHFRVPVEKGLKIVRNLNACLSGIANPTYIVYLPNGAGKVPLSPNYLLEHTEDGYFFKNLEGKNVLYRERSAYDLATYL